MESREEISGVAKSSVNRNNWIDFQHYQMTYQLWIHPVAKALLLELETHEMSFFLMQILFDFYLYLCKQWVLFFLLFNNILTLPNYNYQGF